MAAQPTSPYCWLKPCPSGEAANSSMRSSRYSSKASRSTSPLSGSVSGRWMSNMVTLQAGERMQELVNVFFQDDNLATAKQARKAFCWNSEGSEGTKVRWQGFQEQGS